ncbi:hypothetical protein WA158_000125 [Blastocystis sp. Blastoise]
METQPLCEPEQKPVKKCYVPKRYIIVFLDLFAILCGYTMRANLSTAVLKISEQYGWDASSYGTSLSAFFVGYFFFQVVGGALARRFEYSLIRITIVMLLGILVSSILTLITPFICGNFYVFLGVRFLMGVFQSVLYPTTHCLLSFWASPSERGSFVGICWAGSALGTLIANVVCGPLCELDFLGGWPLCFYIFGLLGIFWCILWMIFGADTPYKYSTISEEELALLEQDKLVDDSLLQEERDSSMHINPLVHPETPAPQRLPTPWLSLCFSPVALSIYFINFSVNWAQFTMVTCLPTYINKRFHPDSTLAGILAGFPYAAQAIMNFVAGSLTDCFIRKGCLPIHVRLGVQTYGNVMMAIFFIISGWIDDVYWDTVVLSVAIMHLGFANTGFGPRILDVAGHYSSEMMGISNSFGALPGIISPILTSIMTAEDQASADLWRNVFYLGAGLLLISALLFILFGKQNLVDFNKRKPQNDLQEPLVVDVAVPVDTNKDNNATTNTIEAPNNNMNTNN